jgi:oxygen-independent coproporphyrinogen-3 oxidase
MTPKSKRSVQTSVYVHFPWCLKKCPYCDFNSYATSSVERRRDGVPHEAYADAVLRELALRKSELAGRTLASIFFGGGTPSLWSAEALGRVLAGIRAAFPREVADLEVTVECNPTSLDRAHAAALRAVGVTRLSVGIQSLDPDHLRFLGRLHDGSLALRALADARAEVDRVNADLMFGLPGQKPEHFLADVEAVLQTGVDHISAYALTIEPGTQFGELQRKGRLPLADEDDSADAYLRTDELLSARGFVHYEVSNYALPGHEARHNQHYWRGGDYVGLGAGAVGCLTYPDGTARRWRNEPLPTRYLERSGTQAVEAWAETLSPTDRIREAFMLGLRTREGVDVRALAARTGIDPLVGREEVVARRIASGELEWEGDRLRVPPRHWLLLDGIVSDLF